MNIKLCILFVIHEIQITINECNWIYFIVGPLVIYNLYITTFSPCVYFTADGDNWFFNRFCFWRFHYTEWCCFTFYYKATHELGLPAIVCVFVVPLLKVIISKKYNILIWWDKCFFQVIECGLYWCGIWKSVLNILWYSVPHFLFVPNPC